MAYTLMQSRRIGIIILLIAATEGECFIFKASPTPMTTKCQLQLHQDVTLATECAVKCKDTAGCVFMYRNSSGCTLCLLDVQTDVSEQISNPLFYFNPDNAPVVQSPDCQMEGGYRQHGGSLYMMCMAAKRWSEANATCTALGASLVEVNNEQESQFLYQQMYDITLRSSSTWMEEYAGVEMGDGFLGDYPWDTTSGTCQWFCNANVYGPNLPCQVAEYNSLGPGGIYCTLYAGKRASPVNNPDVLSYEKKTGTGELGSIQLGFWSGGNKRNFNNGYRWNTADVNMTYTNWPAGFPNDLNSINYDCMMFWQSSGYAWDDVYCSNTAHFICEI